MRLGDLEDREGRGLVLARNVFGGIHVTHVLTEVVAGTFGLEQFTVH